ncbi:prephenate/arogenate dehydrogenase [Microcoleus sp. PH2017_30_WIL_O_A]|uniref:prephenate/arogenate dehydrogenase n=1 Tax=Microcoleus sp. PH2017_30_WIL_O_A TaxID=2798840 RepID=UPI001E190C26|nr:prephenate/arogenate dehydrogenase [Microcoleus sp. PH2017_30_WIL_O_A]MCC3587500.1 prephenate/arogenate dehydrogenase [Microcoleus sp. PH2017_30_WIL_O_A]
MNIGIVGLGLIGGSIALDLRSRGFNIVGVSSRQQTCDRAIARGVVNDASIHLSLMATADLVFICTPLSAIEPIVQKLIPHLSPDAIVTDVGSVKTPIVDAVSALWPNFVGGHPMAGTAESGIEAAVRDLFVGRPYVVTPTAQTPAQSVEKVEEIARLLGASVYRCGPQEHDRAVAWISHLPIMASATLVAACDREGDRDIVNLAQNLASSGFRDTSRVGGGNPELGVMVAKYNREQLLRSLSIYRDSLDELMGDIEAEDWQALEQKLKLTQQAREHYNL